MQIAFFFFKNRSIPLKNNNNNNNNKNENPTNVTLVTSGINYCSSLSFLAVADSTSEQVYINEDKKK
jgi:hypothetical protein